ncbi:MAG: aldehyde ferredoxin oxidoreductase N-terminal domain-containing protein [Candidatus Ozemobacteraceae bacterium]
MINRAFRMMDINLTTGETRITDVTNLFDEYLGGTGVATKLLLEMSPQLDPFSPEAPVIFAIGPFSNIFPVATKTVALFKSPLTGNLGESHAGGRLAMALYGAGIHVLRITGRAPTLSYLVIDEETAVIKRANSLKGMSALATERMLREREDSEFKRSIIRIGPAGERLSPIGEVTVDCARHFGRLGLGGVLGSKNLKALMVSGGRYWAIDNKAPFQVFYKKLYESVVKSPLMKKYHELGTPVNVVPLSKINGMPTRNFSQGSFEGAHSISGEAFAEKHLIQQIACTHCQVGCIHMASLREQFSAEEQHYKTFKVSYDHELIYAWGSNLSIGSTEEILRLLLIVEKQGWDAISMGTTLAWTVDAFTHGFITDKETGGLIPAFGDAKTFEKMLNHIISGHNEFYRRLEKGSAFCARLYGGKDYAIAFGGNEAAGYSTGLWAFLGYATGVRHSHLDSAGYSVDQGNLSKPQSDEELTKSMYKESVWRMVLNSLVICLFARNVYTKDVILEGLETLGVTGWTEDRLMTAAKKIHALKYKFKADCGFLFEEQELPKRLLRTVTSNGLLSDERFRTEMNRYKNLVEEDRRNLGI